MGCAWTHSSYTMRSRDCQSMAQAVGESGCPTLKGGVRPALQAQQRQQHQQVVDALVHGLAVRLRDCQSMAQVVDPTATHVAVVSDFETSSVDPIGALIAAKISVAGPTGGA